MSKQLPTYSPNKAGPWDDHVRNDECDTLNAIDEAQTAQQAWTTVVRSAATQLTAATDDVDIAFTESSDLTPAPSSSTAITDEDEEFGEFESAPPLPLRTPAKPDDLFKQPVYAASESDEEESLLSCDEGSVSEIEDGLLESDDFVELVNLRYEDTVRTVRREGIMGLYNLVLTRMQAERMARRKLQIQRGREPDRGKQGTKKSAESDLNGFVMPVSCPVEVSEEQDLRDVDQMMEAEQNAWGDENEE